jgi:hypothetical protein
MYLQNRILTYNIQGEHLKKETSIISSILHNNGFPKNPTKPPHPKPTKQKTDAGQQHTPTTQWATFTYTGKIDR